MSKWPMRGHFRYLRFETFSMTPRTPQCEVFWPCCRALNIRESRRTPTPHFFQVLGFTLTLGQSRVATYSPLCYCCSFACWLFLLLRCMWFDEALPSLPSPYRWCLVVCHVSGSSCYITTTGALLMVHHVALLLQVHYYPCPLPYASGGAPLQLERKGKFSVFPFLMI